MLLLHRAPVAIRRTYTNFKNYVSRAGHKGGALTEVRRLHLATIEALATAIDARDQASHCHVRRVQIYAARMGGLMNLSKNETRALEAGALLHDIGKLAVPDYILNKPDKLTVAEFERVKIHTSVGAEMLERINFPYPVVPVVRHHHEQWSGLGYPDGLKGEEIPLTARIFAVVDCFDVVREDRPYRRAIARDEACALLRDGADLHFDARVVNVFLANLKSFEKEIAIAGLDHYGLHDEECGSVAAAGESNFADALMIGVPHPTERDFVPPPHLLEIKSAHREVYALYDIARALCSSLGIEETATVLVEKLGQVVPFDTCAVYLYDEANGYAVASAVAGCHAAAVRGRAVGVGEGAIGFVLANRRATAEFFDPMLDFLEVKLPEDVVYRSMCALPLVKNERLVGALVVYSFAAHCYTDDHLRVLDKVAHLATDALANALQHAESEANALTDTLTNLPNGRALRLRFEQEAARARRTGGHFQVVMLDLDNFKQVNDTFGHTIGDRVLREAARILQAQLREYDFLARYAGDEFVAIVQDLSAAQVDELRERIENAITKFSIRMRPNRHARVGVSIGAAAYGTHGETLDQLLIAADQAMYAVKSNRKKALVTSDTESNVDINAGALSSTTVN